MLPCRRKRSKTGSRCQGPASGERCRRCSRRGREVTPRTCTCAPTRLLGKLHGSRPLTQLPATGAVSRCCGTAYCSMRRSRAGGALPLRLVALCCGRSSRQQYDCSTAAERSAAAPSRDSTCWRSLPVASAGRPRYPVRPNVSAPAICIMAGAGDSASYERGARSRVMLDQMHTRLLRLSLMAAKTAGLSTDRQGTSAGLCKPMSIYVWPCPVQSGTTVFTACRSQHLLIR